ncbi:hypothetical protein GA0111570_101140 [Raineyella antarctica]|uniref:Glycosyl transferase family 2 n=1 Tax=Raineyella antarctica TaxID=1577474 RepID=A0A1G6GD80_9ACTN|nr:hypothetical protein GA0111570_101140 [Raineyella antarctica]
MWLESSLSRYYSLLDALVVVAPTNRRGWTGRPVPVDLCLEIIARVDTRNIRQVVWGQWEDHAEPMRADTAQRQAGIDALGDTVDWLFQIDNDELLPDPGALLEMVDEAEAKGIGAVEWPMRVLFRRLPSGDYLEVCSSSRAPRYDYPGPIAIRSHSRAVDARRCEGATLRVTVKGDDESLQLRHEPAEGEVRVARLGPEQAILHNSWGREPGMIRQKIRTWGHASGIKGQLYYWLQWFPAPITWRWMRDIHPFARGLWPRLSRTRSVRMLLVDADR